MTEQVCKNDIVAIKKHPPDGEDAKPNQLSFPTNNFSMKNHK